MIIEQPARFLRWIYPHAVWRMDPSEKAVYLTFDDGPIPEATPFVLDVLKCYGIHATFFMVGDNVRKHPDIFRQVVMAGHRIGNHTFNHIGGFRWPSWKYLENTRKAEEIMENAVRACSLDPSNTFHSPLGLAASSSDSESEELSTLNSKLSTLPSPLFRPPHGWMRPMQYQAIRRQGYRIIMWDLVTRDYSRRLTAEEVLENVKHYARNGSIITFHDSLRSIEKLQIILPEALEWLIEKGYEFKIFE